MKNRTLPFLTSALALAVCLAVSLALPGRAAQADRAVFTFAADGVTASGSSEGVSVDGAALTVTKAGSYTVTGSCGEGSITVAKGVTGVTLELSDLTLASSSTAPLVCKKGSEVTLVITGSVTLTDREDPADETGADADAAEAFEGAAIKVKSGASLTVTGTGTLNADGSACKNGIKGAAGAAITVADGVKLNVTAANNGLACDGSVTVTGGTLTVTAGNDGVKAEPEEDDDASAGTVTITGGTVRVTSGGDGVQASGEVRITGGALSVTAYGGWQAKDFDKDTMSAKGVKSDTLVTVTGGTLRLDCADDAVHCNGDVTVTGGTFTIATGDDALHADGDLTLGAPGADDGPEITVTSCYEGFEGATVTLNAGKGVLRASDDGVNAANSDLGRYAFCITINGGAWTVDSDGDGLDSNANVSVTGGVTEIYGAARGDNAALDYDGACSVTGGTLLAVGSAGMAQIPSSGVYVSFGGGMGGFGGRGGMTGGTTAAGLGLSQGSVFAILDGEGSVLYTSTARKAAGSVVFASDRLTAGQTCTLTVNGTAAATATASAGNGQTGGFPGGSGRTGAFPGGSGQTGAFPGGSEQTGAFPGGSEQTGGFPGGSGRTGGFPGGSGQTGAFPGGSEQTGAFPGGNGQTGAFPGGNGQPGSFPGGGRSGDSLPFIDVAEDSWARNAIGFVTRGGIFRGTSGTTFQPEGRMTRAMLAQVLYNLDGGDAPVSGSPFSDVAEDQWYAGAVSWARSRGVVSGYTDGTFRPDEGVTREQIALMLYHYAESKGYDVSARGDLDGFADGGDVSGYARPAMEWAVGAGLISGFGGGVLDPGGTATRAQVASILMNFSK